MPWNIHFPTDASLAELASPICSVSTKRLTLEFPPSSCGRGLLTTQHRLLSPQRPLCPEPANPSLWKALQLMCLPDDRGGRYEAPRNPCSANTTHCLVPVPTQGPAPKKGHPHLPLPHPSSYPALGFSYFGYFILQSQTLSSAAPQNFPELDMPAGRSIQKRTS